MPAMSGAKGSSDWTDSGLVILHTKQGKAEYIQALQPQLFPTQGIDILFNKMLCFCRTNISFHLFNPNRARGAIIIFCRKIAISLERNIYWTSEQSVKLN